MSNVIDCICRLGSNKVLITIPTLQKDMTYVVVGICNLDNDFPTVTVRKNEPEAKATFNVPVNLVGSIIVNDFEMDKIKIKFAGVNFNGDECYVTKKGTYIAVMNDTFYRLNSAPEYGLDGIDGEPMYPVKKEQFEIVESFDN